MDPIKVGEFIKEIRKKNHLTQKALADKYGVTYQAVSKWENGKNLPDITLLREMSKDFQIELSDILDGEIKVKKKSKKIIIVCILLLIMILFVIIIYKNKDKSFEFKTLSSVCPNFTVSGSIAYDTKKSSIYISNIDYCGEEDVYVYQKIECNLFENSSENISKISSCSSKENVTLEEYLKDLKLNIDNYEQTCKNYTKDSLYLEINAYQDEDIIKTYKIPLSLDKNCK